MKKLLIAGGIAATVLAVFIANKPIAQSAPSHQKEVSYIPLDTGLAYIAMYSKLCGTHHIPKNVALRSFTIPRADLIDLLGIDTTKCGIHFHYPFDRARAYMGYSGSTNEFHLVFTPVVDNGTPAGKDTILTDAKGQKIVFDLTTPCPNTCDYTSELYQVFDAHYK